MLKNQSSDYRWCAAFVLLLLTHSAHAADQPGGIPEEADELAVWVIYEDQPHPRVPPAGWMPGGQGIALDTACKNPAPFSGETCISIQYLTNHPWVGVAHNVDGIFEKTKQPLDVFASLNGRKGDAIELRVWARSEKGANVVFEFGGGAGSTTPFAQRSKLCGLNPEWKMHRIDLTNQDLSGLSGKVFTWLARAQDQEAGVERVDFQLDRIHVARIQRAPLKAGARPAGDR